MRRNQLNPIIEVVKGDVAFTKGDAKQATVHYKYKKDFAMLSFGDHYSLVRSKDVVGRTAIDLAQCHGMFVTKSYMMPSINATLNRRVILESGRQKTLQ
jgi:hypothetical protein